MQERYDGNVPAPAGYDVEQRPAEQPKGRRGGALREFVQTILIAVLIFVAVRAFVLPYEVDGSSMQPGLHDRDRVLVNRQSYTTFDLNGVLNWIPGVDREGAWLWSPFGDLERGDIVVLEPPVDADEPFIKRIVGLPGDTVSFSDGYVILNGERLDESYIPEAITTCDPDNALVDQPTCDITVPDGYVYVLGDNRTPRGSEDSRMFGLVPQENLHGEAFLINWPFDRIGGMP
ncbi:MAG TPA: signal peptidase I [Thermomicrobiales bacterium]|jgi:signal peptidase I|nr:signal peptidase I [Thermomicrobiales bacterium]